ncbi:efflux RND transporter periplasmic adaptor subunit [Sedimentitalea sp. XS_ASV28]|uniref:efflux RND transporter periplasmic adaptor subunit n=1 Tax=Sedimentitalea sp. XS_ASV28 TaxID=3241296 RepID=UPI003512B14D
MSLWKQFLILGILAVLAIAGYEAFDRYAGSSDDAGIATPVGARAAVVELARAETSTLSQTVEAVGTSRARQSVEIVPQAEGRVVEMNFAAGERVEEGTVLVRLDDTIERADLTEAEARLRERGKVFERMTQLSNSNAVAEAALEDSIARLAEARAELDRARQRLSERSIRAPFSGIVGLAEVDRGARVAPGTVITRLDDLNEIEVEFSLPETLFARVRTGQRLVATSIAFPGQGFTGQIDAVDSRIDPISRAFRTRAIIPNPDGLLPAGMFMALELTLSQDDFVVVPEEAIIFQAAETYVFTVQDGIARRTRVTTGQRRDGMVAVLDGLDAGADVVVRGLHRVHDGNPVEILGAPPSDETPDGADS